MTDTRSQPARGRETSGQRVTDGPVRVRRGLRIALLSLATAIVLLGAAAATAYGYLAISNARRAARVATIAAIASSAPAATVWIGVR